MDQTDEIINRVSSSALVTFDLEEYYTPGERVTLDIAPQLHQGIILKEKEFREFIKTHDWTSYKGKYIAVTCSVDAIIPTWAFMLVVTAVQPYAGMVVLGDLEDLERQLFFEKLAAVKWENFEGGKVVVKGCSKVYVPDSVYVELTRRLRPRVQSLFFGEPCSTVPVFKRPKV